MAAGRHFVAFQDRALMKGVDRFGRVIRQKHVTFCYAVELLTHMAVCGALRVV